jgi:hypothetical protein
MGQFLAYLAARPGEITTSTATGSAVVGNGQPFPPYPTGIDSLADPEMRLAQVLPPPEGHRISSSPDVPPPERIPLELLVNAEPSSQDTSHSDKTRILWGQGPRSPGPIIKDVPQYQVQQPAEANPPKPSLSPTAPISSSNRWLGSADPNTAPERSARRLSKR